MWSLEPEHKMWPTGCHARLQTIPSWALSIAPAFSSTLTTKNYIFTLLDWTTHVKAHSLFLPVDRLEHCRLSWPNWTLVELANLNIGWAGQLEHGRVGQLEHGWAGQLEHWLSWPAWTWLSWPTWTLVELANLNIGWAGQLEHDWAGQLEHGCWQACSCMLEQTIHCWNHHDKSTAMFMHDKTCCQGMMKEQDWTAMLQQPGTWLLYDVLTYANNPCRFAKLCRICWNITVSVTTKLFFLEV